jgi:hypothetical protein
MITNFTPGAYMVHDMLHMRGGHQVNWFIDGISVVNTNIAANVAPLIDPKNVEELEIERGGFSSEYGDRTYGFFNAVTPSGFERNNEAEVVASAGSFYSTDDQINIGSHTRRFAYSASIDGSRSELGLAPPHVGDSGIPVRLRLSRWKRTLASSAALYLRPVHRQGVRREVDPFRERCQYRQHALSVGY